ncbi:sporulation protein [Rossellomorea aquimaris]|uniref:sporulation protein n=1 Tax=Rossellomorea aquimaris TaxID=189382 RepID=UPI001CD51540|nr:sporulation protein [Rossellomorea aquimaris]MCA1053767.1 sporulation protein [Rossellomorea aquimaris]
MLLRKYASLFGIGSAKIDLVLPKTVFSPGELLNGHFLLEGGIVKQKLKRIECDLIMVDKHSQERTIDSTTIYKREELKPDETNKLNFVYRLPKTLKANEKGVRYLFKTKLTFDKGVESLDEDWISIVC